MARKRNYNFSLWISVIALLVLTLFAFLGGLAAPHNPLAMEFAPAQPPSLTNWFGTDNIGRDVFSRFMVGARISFIIGVASIIIASFIGTFLGLCAAYFKSFQTVLMRLIDAIWAFPTILLGLALAASLEPGVGTVIVAISVVYCPLFARLSYGTGISLLERDFVLAAKAFGCGSMRMLFTHILPNLAAPLIIQATLTVGTAIVLESSLSFLGVGIQPPTPSWGIMMRTGYKWLEQAPWMAILPGVGIYVTVVSFSVIGDWLRVKLDPKQKLERA